MRKDRRFNSARARAVCRPAGADMTLNACDSAGKLGSADTNGRLRQRPRTGVNYRVAQGGRAATKSATTEVTEIMEIVDQTEKQRLPSPLARGERGEGEG